MLYTGQEKGAWPLGIGEKGHNGAFDAETSTCSASVRFSGTPLAIVGLEVVVGIVPGIEAHEAFLETAGDAEIERGSAGVEL